MESVATGEFWDKYWELTSLEVLSPRHPLYAWLDKEVPETKTDSCIEIGCYPGKFLTVFGEKGYELNGIDFFPGTKSLPSWLKNLGYKCGEFCEVDFTGLQLKAKYDLVCSFGFIEHFYNWSEMLDKHLEILKLGGKVVVEVPNLNSPIYHLLYRWLEPETLKNHVLSVMHLKLIESELTAKGCRVDYADYLGHFHFRFSIKHGRMHKLIARIVNLCRPVFALFPRDLNCRYIGVIATKVR